MATSTDSIATINLGKRLVQELGLEESNDTLSRWMAHYLAAKIEQAQSAKGDKLKAAERECFRATLELWEHRIAFPDNRRPFREFEPIFETLSALDVEKSGYRYYREAQAAGAGDSVTSSRKKWLDTAASIDAAARVLIRYCLAVAAEDAVDRARDWIRLVDALNGPLPFDVQIVRFITSDVDALKTQSASELERKRLEALMQRLDMFRTFSTALAKRLNRQLLMTRGAKKQPRTGSSKGRTTTQPSGRRRRSSK